MDINELAAKLPTTKSRVLFLDRICRAAPEGAFVECGVYAGWSAAVMINAADGKRKIFLCDSYAGFPDAPEEPENVKKIVLLSEAKKMTEDVVRGTMKRVGVPLDGVVFVKGFFKDSLPRLAETMDETNDKIAVLHFDGDLYMSAMDVFKELLPKMAKGGYVAVHDYPGFAGVKKAVEETFDVGKLVVEGPQEVYFKVE